MTCLFQPPQSACLSDHLSVSLTLSPNQGLLVKLCFAHKQATNLHIPPPHHYSVIHSYTITPLENLTLTFLRKSSKRKNDFKWWQATSGASTRWNDFIYCMCKISFANITFSILNTYIVYMCYIHTYIHTYLYIQQQCCVVYNTYIYCTYVSMNMFLCRYRYKLFCIY